MSRGTREEEAEDEKETEVKDKRESEARKIESKRRKSGGGVICVPEEALGALVSRTTT